MNEQVKEMGASTTFPLLDAVVSDNNDASLAIVELHESFQNLKFDTALKIDDTEQKDDATPSLVLTRNSSKLINFFFRLFTTLGIGSTVEPIVEDVRKRGHQAVLDMTAKFDGVSLDKLVEHVSDLPAPQLERGIQEAFDVAYENIKAFHRAQRVPDLVVETMKGVVCKRMAWSIESVGLYVPGGTAVLPSTALMLAVPAQLAGCKNIILATPPRPDGSISKEVIYCAKKSGVTHILKAGGAQAISAMSWGTISCPKIKFSIHIMWQKLMENPIVASITVHASVKSVMLTDFSLT